MTYKTALGYVFSTRDPSILTSPPLYFECEAQLIANDGTGNPLAPDGYQCPRKHYKEKNRLLSPSITLLHMADR